MTVTGRLTRAAGGAVLLFVALWMPVIGSAASASEDVKGRKYWGFLESDWFFWFALVAAGACVWAAIRLVRAAVTGTDSPH